MDSGHYECQLADDREEGDEVLASSIELHVLDGKKKRKNKKVRKEMQNDQVLAKRSHVSEEETPEKSSANKRNPVFMVLFLAVIK